MAHYPCCNVLPCNHAEYMLFAKSGLDFLLTALAHLLKTSIYSYIFIFLVKNGIMRVFNIFKNKRIFPPPPHNPPPLDPTNPLYCRLPWSIYTIYVRGKLGQVRGVGVGGHTFILKILKTLIIPFWTGNRNAFIHV